MKKLSIYLCAVCALIFSLIACEPTGPVGPDQPTDDTNQVTPPPTKVDTLTLKYQRGSFVGEDVADGLHSFVTTLRTDDVKIDNKTGDVSGNGYYFVVTFTTEKGNELYPTLGEYKIASKQAKGTMTAMAYKVEDGKATESKINSGTMKIEKTGNTTTISGDLSSKDVKFVLNFRGTLRYKNECTKYYLEPMEKINENFDALECEFMRKMGQQEGYDIYDIFLTGGFYDVYIKFNSKGLAGTDINNVVGEYQILPGDVENSVNRGFSTYQENGPNGQSGYVLRPTYACEKDASGNAKTVWWGYSGSVKIEKDKITCKFTSAYGSTFTVTYKGTVVVKDPMGAPAL